MAGDANKDLMRQLTEQIGRGGERRKKETPVERERRVSMDRRRMRDLTKDIGRGTAPDAAIGRGGLFEEAFGPTENVPYNIPSIRQHAYRINDAIRASSLGGGVAIPPFNPENPQGFLASQLAATDPHVVHTMLDEVGRIGQEHNFPVTARGLKAIEPTVRSATSDPYAHHRRTGDREWRMGISGRQEDQLRRLIQKDLDEGWTTGGMRGNALGGPDPLRQVAAHEMGHAIESGVDQFYNEPAMLRGQRNARAEWMRLRQQIGADTLNSQLSKYPGQFAVKNVLNPVLSEGLALKQRGLAMPHYLDNYFALAQQIRAGNVTPEAIAALDPVMQGRLAREGIAESLGPALTRRLPGAPVTGTTARAIGRGEELLGHIDELRGLGYRGSITPGMALKGTAAFAAPLLAPIIADQLPKQYQPVAQGAITGMGIGGLAGPQGMLIGAGIGAGGAMLKQVFS